MRRQPGGSVGENDVHAGVDASQFVGERGHRGAVADIENVRLYPRDRGADRYRRIGKTLRPAPGEVDDVIGCQALRQAFRESQSETLVRAGDNGNPAHDLGSPAPDRTRAAAGETHAGSRPRTAASRSMGDDAAL